MSEREHDSGGAARSGWWVVLLICAALLGWVLIQYATIRDAPARWDFGVLPDVPGESAGSTSRPERPQPAPLQMQPLPEATSRPSGGPP